MRGCPARRAAFEQARRTGERASSGNAGSGPDGWVNPSGPPRISLSPTAGESACADTDGGGFPAIRTAEAFPENDGACHPQAVAAEKRSGGTVLRATIAGNGPGMAKRAARARGDGPLDDGRHRRGHDKPESKKHGLLINDNQRVNQNSEGGRNHQIHEKQYP